MLAGHWYELWYYDIHGQVQYWTPPFPGAPRRLAGVDYWFSNPAAQDSQWVADIGLELPPALVPGTLTNTLLGDQWYEEHEIGFYPVAEARRQRSMGGRRGYDRRLSATRMLNHHENGNSPLRLDISHP